MTMEKRLKELRKMVAQLGTDTVAYRLRSSRKAVDNWLSGKNAPRPIFVEKIDKVLAEFKAAA